MSQNLFVQDRIPLCDDVKLTTGIKIENSSYSNVDFMPDLRLAWQVDRHRYAVGAVSRAVRTPSKIDRELKVARHSAARRRAFIPRSSPPMKLGYRGEPLLAAFAVGVALSTTTMTICAPPAPDPVTILPMQLRNGITGDSYGVEAWAKYGLTDWWRLSLGVNWLQRT